MILPIKREVCMKILFFGDSITDMRRDKDCQDFLPYSYGTGYAFLVANELLKKDNDLVIYNRGISGNRIVDLYSRIQSDVWDYAPDVLSILIGVNDVWHDIAYNNGVDLKTYEKTYIKIIEETMQKFPQIKIMILEPFLLKAMATITEWERFKKVYKYASVAKKIAKKYGLTFVPLQKKFDKLESQIGTEKALYDGVHPNILGCDLIKGEWLKAYKKL